MARAKIKKVAAAEIRAAKKFLNRKGFKGSEIPPRLLSLLELLMEIQ